MGNGNGDGNGNGNGNGERRDEKGRGTFVRPSSSEERSMWKGMLAERTMSSWRRVVPFARTMLVEPSVVNEVPGVS